MKWVGDILELNDDNWREIWDFPFSPLVSARDKRVQYKIVHRVHYTPHRLHQMLPANSPACWRCSHQPGDFFHIFWSCPALAHYWKQVLQVIHGVTRLVVPCDPKHCLLGLVEQMPILRTRKILISLLLYYARKAITMTWKQSSPPSVKFWKSLVNASLPLYKATYLSRGCPQKFDKVWSCWVDNATASDAITSS